MDAKDDERRGEAYAWSDMKVVVGSTNPVKVEAVRVVVGGVWQDAVVEGVEIASGVGEQPMSEEETRRGAINRARGARQLGDMGVGIEGGVCLIGGKLFECAWAAVVDERHKVGLGGGLYFELPESIAKRIRQGEELGPIMQELMRYDIKRSEGAVGVLTGGRLTRQTACEQILESALVRFISPEWYD